MKRIHFNILLYITTILAFLFWKPILLFLFPGILLFYTRFFKKFSFSESVFFVIVISLSFWITGFGLLKFIHLSITGSIAFVITACLALTLVNINRKILININYADIVPFGLAIFIFLALLPLYQNSLAPAGADMATHTYTAKLIAENNSFPQSYEPILPIQNFGSSPVGFSTITALLSLASGLAVYRTAIWVLIISYVLITTSLYFYLKYYFGKFASLVSILFILFVGWDIRSYMSWGGNPTILSIGLLIAALVLMRFILIERNLKFVNSLLLGILLYASFATHYIPPISAGFFLILLFLVNLVNKKIKKTHLVFFLRMALVMIVFSLPFLTSIQMPSKATLDWVKDWQSIPNFEWSPIITITNSFYTIPEYVVEKMGRYIYLTSFFGLIVAGFTKIKHRIYHMMVFLVLFIIILNSRYWFLPLSPLLYPDRVITTYVIPFSFFIGVLFYYLINSLKQHFKNHRSSFRIISLVVYTLSIFLFSSQIVSRALFSYKNKLKDYENHVSVTDDDLKAFDWIAKNTPEIAIFYNNYGDAGIWLPAIAFRTVMSPDLYPAQFDEWEINKPNLIPTHIFVGSKQVYVDDIWFTSSWLDSSHNVELLYSAGESRVYEIIEPL